MCTCALRSVINPQSKIAVVFYPATATTTRTNERASSSVTASLTSRARAHKLAIVLARSSVALLSISTGEYRQIADDTNYAINVTDYARCFGGGRGGRVSEFMGSLSPFAKSMFAV